MAFVRFGIGYLGPSVEDFGGDVKRRGAERGAGSRVKVKRLPAGTRG